MKKKQVYELSPELSVQFTLGYRSMIYIDQAILSAIFDFCEVVKKSPYYKHKIKMLVKRIKSYNRYYNWQLAKMTFNSIQTFADETDEFMDKTKHDQDILFYSVKNSFLKGLPDKSEFAEMYAYIFIIQRMIDINRENMHDWFMFFRSLNLEISRDTALCFESTDVYKACQKLVEELNKVFDIAEETEIEGENIYASLNIFKAKLLDLNTIADAVEKVGVCKMKIDRDKIYRPKHYELPDKYK